MQATMTVRTDANLKAVFTSLCEEFGMSANTAMNVFMRAVAETKAIPFIIGRKKTQRDIEGERLMELMEKNRQARIASNAPELTMEEIDAEIAACRAERYAKQKAKAV